jgi:hypothetical protein
MKRWFEVLANIIFWVITARIITHQFTVVEIEHLIDNGVESIKAIRSNELTIKLAWCIAFSFVVFYINLYIITRFNRDKPLIFMMLKSIGVLSICVASFFLLLSTNVLPSFPKISTSVLWGVFAFYYSTSVAYGISKAWITTEMQRKSLLVGKKQAELNLLRSQLHPHFLFNTLNNLLSMVDQKKDPALASAIDKLSGLLRYVVYDAMEKNVSIQQEIDFIRNYAQLQQLRFEDNEIQFNLSISGSYDQQRIEPGIFIPFVENAFKHGARPEYHATINASFDLTHPNKIIFEIQNPLGFQVQNPEKSGVGIASSKERLQLVYPKMHTLEILQEEMFSVHLEIVTDEGNYS